MTSDYHSLQFSCYKSAVFWWRAGYIITAKKAQHGRKLTTVPPKRGNRQITESANILHWSWIGIKEGEFPCSYLPASKHEEDASEEAQKIVLGSQIAILSVKCKWRVWICNNYESAFKHPQQENQLWDRSLECDPSPGPRTVFQGISYCELSVAFFVSNPQEPPTVSKIKCFLCK